MVQATPAGRRAPSVWRDGLSGGDAAAAVSIFLFVAWGVFGLTESPGFMMDEPLIIDPALTLLRRGILAIPGAGPGFGNGSAMLYQTPLSIFATATVFQVFGPGLLQGRAVSLAISALALAIYYLALRPLSRRGALLSTLLLMTDPMLTERAREIRYDSIALLGLSGALWAFVRWIDEENPSKRRLYLFMTGAALALSINSHVLYALHVPALVFAVLVLQVRRRASLASSIGELACAAAPIGLGVLPFAAYALSNIQFFVAQMGHQVTVHQGVANHRGNWAALEAAKYVSYYRFAPLIFLSELGSGVGAAWLVFRSGAALEETWRNRAAGLLALTATATVELSIVSGHWPWHHLMVAPLWALMPLLLLEVSRRTKTARWSSAAAGVAALAILNGLVGSWGLRTFSAVANWGERDPRQFYPALRAVIPRGALVYGDYRLLFIAFQDRWNFTFEQTAFPVDRTAIRSTRYDYIVKSELTSDLVQGLDARYVLVRTLTATKSPYAGAWLHRRVEPMQLWIYRRADGRPRSSPTRP